MRNDSHIARFQKHARRGWTCYCGVEVWGNGGMSSHARACKVYREKRGVFVPDWQRMALYDGGMTSEQVDQYAKEAAEAGRDRL